MSDSFDYSKRKPTTQTVKSPNLQGSNLGRVLPRQNSSGSTRGILGVGQGDTVIDGANNIISVGSPDGTQGLGTIPNETNQWGFFQTDSSNTIIYKQVQGTSYYYNPNDSYVNSILIGFAPDNGRPGIWVAKPTFDATELLS